MKTIRIGAVVAAVASAGALALTLAPSSAEVSSVVGNGTTDVRFSYVLDGQDPVSPTRPVANQPCVQTSGNGGPFRYETTTLSVAVSGAYRFVDQFADFDAHLEAYLTPVPSTLTPTCAFSVDDDDTWNLVAGQTYYVALTNFSGLAQGTGSFRVTGPGAISVGELTAGQALAACAPGAVVPEGYTLREGTAKSETLTGTDGKDLIRGLGGNDTIRGLAGDDILCGGEGLDTIDGGAGNDFVFGLAGQDTLSGGVGADHLDGGLGYDNLTGGDGADTLVGGEGQDTLYGQGGDDELFGNAGNDVLDGGAGNDVGTDTDPRSVFRNVETVNGPAPTPTPTQTTAAAR